VDVVEDVGREEADRHHAPFFTWVTRHRPFVIAKAAISSDGFVGLPSRPVRLTGPEADRFFHRQRAEIDAIAVGGATVVADDPLLTARGAYRFRPLTRVIFDWRGRLPDGARVLATREAGPVIMVVSQAAVRSDPRRFDRLRARGLEIEAVERRDLGPVLAGLARRSIVTLLVEGGPALHAAFVEGGFVDRVQQVVAPHRLGDGVAAAALVPERLLSEGRQTTLGDDILMEFDVHGTD
jgi:diaminohydroxyphosphoribosylaminopyrimidine deaminase/5-amino-6-(5-phosphoribosylamino)uracil reductase